MSHATAAVGSFFEAADLTPELVERVTDTIYESAQARADFEAALRQAREKESGPADTLRIGLALLMLGAFSEAHAVLGKAPDEKRRHFYNARALEGLGRIPDAIAAFEKAAAKGWDAFEIDMRIAALHVRDGNAPAAEKLLSKHAASGRDRGDWYFVSGLLRETRNERVEAAAEYEKTLTLSPDHVPAMFRAAWLHDMAGEDDSAIDLYERLALQPAAHVNALLNLAVLYEDRGRYEQAFSCLKRVLATHPNHWRAKLFYKDVESSRQMIIDEGATVRTESRNRLLETPIGEFELSSRARNCLKKMKIGTLGDLLKFSEAELLAYKNFGETSLMEIKTLLTKKGLRLGQRPDEIDASAVVVAATEAPPTPRVHVPPGAEAALSRPVSELELSVRARRCLQRLNIGTLGDLIQRTEAELLATRNFGQTSLNEIKSRLTEFGLTLATKV